MSGANLLYTILLIYSGCAYEHCCKMKVGSTWKGTHCPAPANVGNTSSAMSVVISFTYSVAAATAMPTIAYKYVHSCRLPNNAKLVSVNVSILFCILKMVPTFETMQIKTVSSYSRVSCVCFIAHVLRKDTSTYVN